MGSAVQVGPPAGWEPLLSSALQELSVARHLSCSVSGLARFNLPQAPSRQGLRQVPSGHTRVTWAEHRHSAVQHWHPTEPTHSAPPLSLQEAGVSERCLTAPDIGGEAVDRTQLSGMGTKSHRWVVPEIAQTPSERRRAGNWIVFNQQFLHGVPKRSLPVDAPRAQGWDCSRQSSVVHWSLQLLPGPGGRKAVETP